MSANRDTTGTETQKSELVPVKSGHLATMFLYAWCSAVNSSNGFVVTHVLEEALEESSTIWFVSLVIRLLT